MAIAGGASGGPVFDHLGRVFAVNCSNYDDTSTSYFARVNEALGATVEGVHLQYLGETAARSVTIQELIEH